MRPRKRAALGDYAPALPAKQLADLKQQRRDYAQRGRAPHGARTGYSPTGAIAARAVVRANAIKAFDMPGFLLRTVGCEKTPSVSSVRPA